MTDVEQSTPVGSARKARFEQTSPPSQPVGSIPTKWVTVYSGDMGNTFGPKGFFGRLEPACLVVEVAEIIVHEADEPNVLVHLFDSDALAGEDSAEVYFPPIEAGAPARGHGDGLVVERVIELWQAPIGAR
jgi:hypothetical protein